MSVAIGNDANDGGPHSVPRVPPRAAVRAIAAALGGTLHETFALTLPRIVRGSRLYEATAKNLLRMTIELVGGVEARHRVEDEYEPDPGRLAVRKGAGNVVELGSIAAFGFSPLWILAAAADVTRGSRVYLDAFVAGARPRGALPEGSTPGSVDELLGALEGVSGTTARLVDIPPLELRALRQSLDDIRRDAGTLPARRSSPASSTGSARRSRASGTSPPRGVGRHRPRVLQLGPPRRPPARPRPVSRGPRPRPRRGPRRLRPPRLRRRTPRR